MKTVCLFSSPCKHILIQNIQIPRGSYLNILVSDISYMSSEVYHHLGVTTNYPFSVQTVQNTTCYMLQCKKQWMSAAIRLKKDFCYSQDIISAKSLLHCKQSGMSAVSPSKRTNCYNTQYNKKTQTSQCLRPNPICYTLNKNLLHSNNRPMSEAKR